MSILERLRAKTPGLVPSTMSVKAWTTHAETSITVARGGGRVPVEDSDEWRRVRDVARRAPVDLGDKEHEPGVRAQALVRLMTERLGRGSRACACASMRRPCITTLKPAQAWALYEAPLAGGLLAPIGVGHGKTGLDILLAMVMLQAGEVAVLLVPSGLRSQLVDDYLAWREHWNVPSLVCGERSFIMPGRPVVHVVAYSELSRPQNTDLFRRFGSSLRLIIADEAHKLRNPNTSTTGRVLRVFAEDDSVRLCAYSGTFTAKSIKDYAHLAAIALREASPLPMDPAVVEEWSVAIDPSEWPAPAGVLRGLCAPDENLYQGYHRRLVETRGVVSTKAAPIDASIVIEERKPPPMPAKLLAMLDKVRATSTRPDGEEFVEALETVACARQLGAGFYLRWKFPHGEPASLIDAWFEARKHWNKELRLKLQERVEHMDSPLLAARAAQRALDGYVGELPTWESDCWESWLNIRDRVYHEPDVVWVDDYLVRDAAEWAKKHHGIVWYEYDAFGRRVAELAGLPLYNSGDKKSLAALAKESGKRSIVCSIKSHGTGRDGLQRIFEEQLVANPPASGDTWEQLLGRLHRIGFDGDEVRTWVYRHTDELADAIDRALIQAKYIEGTMGTLQKLLAADAAFTLRREALVVPAGTIRLA